jgi:hypothetical protein
MTGRILIFFSLVFSANIFSQISFLPEAFQKTMIARLKNGDSLVIYQCHVEEVEQQLATAGGQTLTTAPQKYTITEKFVIYRDSSRYKGKYFVSSMLVMPNRKFSGLKIREKDYWNFKKVKDFQLSEKGIKVLAAVEYKGKDLTEYDFVIDKYNTNQVIIRQRKDFRQVNVEGNHILSKLIVE